MGSANKDGKGITAAVATYKHRPNLHVQETEVWDCASTWYVLYLDRKLRLSECESLVISYEFNGALWNCVFIYFFLFENQLIEKVICGFTDNNSNLQWYIHVLFRVTVQLFHAELNNSIKMKYKWNINVPVWTLQLHVYFRPLNHQNDCLPFL